MWTQAIDWLQLHVGELFAFRWWRRNGDNGNGHVAEPELAIEPIVEELPIAIPIEELPIVEDTTTPDERVCWGREPGVPATLDDTMPTFGEGYSGRWHLRGTILDRLDEYFICLRRLKNDDPRAYALFARIGFAIPADVYLNPTHEVNQHLLVKVSVGGCSFTKPDGWPDSFDKGKTRNIVPSFMYFERVVHPTRVQPFPGTIYRFSVLYDDRYKEQHWRSKLHGVCPCHIGVTPANTYHLLREVCHTRHVITTGKRKQRKERMTITGQDWTYPSWLFDVPAEHPGKTMEGWVTELFRLAVLTYQSATEKILIRVAHQDCHGTFGLDISRGKYFFADRDATALTPTGQRKRIFHAVRQHTRRLANGETTVRDHYRGLRDFDWKGYGVHIVLPRHTHILQAPMPGSYEEDLPPKEERAEEYISLGEAGKLLAGVLDE